MTRNRSYASTDNRFSRRNSSYSFDSGSRSKGSSHVATAEGGQAKGKDDDDAMAVSSSSSSSLPVHSSSRWLQQQQSSSAVGSRWRPLCPATDQKTLLLLFLSLFVSSYSAALDPVQRHSNDLGGLIAEEEDHYEKHRLALSLSLSPRSMAEETMSRDRTSSSVAR